MEARAPLAADARIDAMDVLRGFALLGIGLMNIEGIAGPLFQAIDGVDPALRGADRVADAVVYVLVQGKFYTLFSLLFGMGFALMLQRARADGRPFAGLYLRRLLALLAIGLAHALLVWSGDILVSYALVGLVMLLAFRNTPRRRQPVWGVLFYLVPSLLVLAMALLVRAPGAAAAIQPSLDAQGALMSTALEAQRVAYGSGDFAAATARRIADTGLMLGAMLPYAGWTILGMFLLGGWFVSSGAIAHPAEFPGLYRGLRWLALPLGLAAMLLSYRLVPTLDFSRLDMTSAVAATLAAVAGLLMCLGYVGVVVGGLQSPAWRARWALLAPAGRMALTHYLLQSLAWTLLFYGYGGGFFDAMPRAWQLPFVVACFAMQVAASHWWLRRFRFGPAEWLWRSATYLRLQPMRA